LAAAIKNSSSNVSWGFPIAVWGIQLFWIGCAIFFNKTEIPRLTFWIGDVHGYAHTVISINILPDILQRLALFIPELTEANIENIMMEMRKGDNGTTITIPITFYDRPEELLIYRDEDLEFFDEDIDNGEIGLVINTHIDLTNKMQKIFDSYQQ
jgi:hypothetical protein